VIGDVIAAWVSPAVDVLFLTSGLLLYRPFVRARVAGDRLPNRRRYLRRRMLRIVPAYWFALTVLAIFPGIAGVFSGDWWRYYFFLQLYSARTQSTGIAVAWTLCVDVSFYLVLPLYATAIRRVRIGSGPSSWLWSELLPLAAIAAFGAAIQVAGARLAISLAVAESILGNCTWFALGMALAVVSVHIHERGRSPRWLGFVSAYPGACWLAAAACLAALTAVLHPGGLFRIILAVNTKQSYARSLAAIALTFGLCLFLIAPALFGETAGRMTRRVLAWRPLMWVGMVSYGVYLWHLTVVSLLAEDTDPHLRVHGLGLAHKIGFQPTLVLLVLTVAISLVIAGLSYRFVELPFLRLKER
jgi:peptidoglycan/LPS O-acetylase OafA/YrhL